MTGYEPGEYANDQFSLGGGDTDFNWTMLKYTSSTLATGQWMKLDFGKVGLLSNVVVLGWILEPN